MVILNILDTFRTFHHLVFAVFIYIEIFLESLTFAFFVIFIQSIRHSYFVGDVMHFIDYINIYVDLLCHYAYTFDQNCFTRFSFGVRNLVPWL